MPLKHRACTVAVTIVTLFTLECFPKDNDLFAFDRHKEEKMQLSPGKEKTPPRGEEGHAPESRPVGDEP
jgi:hypothetical protein